MIFYIFRERNDIFLAWPSGRSAALPSDFPGSIPGNALVFWGCTDCNCYFKFLLFRQQDFLLVFGNFLKWKTSKLKTRKESLSFVERWGRILRSSSLYSSSSSCSPFTGLAHIFARQKEILRERNSIGKSNCAIRARDALDECGRVRECGCFEGDAQSKSSTTRMFPWNIM